MRHELGIVATACGLIAALGYTITNVCLRSLTGVDPVWVSCVKAMPTVVAMLPVILVRLARGQAVLPKLETLAFVVVAGLVGQLGGNVLFQWSLGVVGIALTVPITLGAMILSGVFLGRWILGDEVSRRLAISSLVLTVAIVVLSMGAQAANSSIASSTQSVSRTPTNMLLVVGGVLAAFVSGTAYSVLSVALRYSTNRGVALPVLLFTIAAVGVLSLGSVSLAQYSWAELWSQTAPQLSTMIASGVFNVIAFLALTKALHLASVAFVNALNASQSALAAIAGVVIFREPLTIALAAGVLLTAAGLMMMKDRRPPKQQVSNDVG